jgi:methyltransferase
LTPDVPATVLLFVIVFGVMAVEARRAARNERLQRARGGIEPDDDVYGLMRIAYPIAFAAMIAEGAFRQAPPRPVLAAGISIFTAAKALKWWAILALGPFWTFRVIVIPDAPLSRRGPYRWLRHPNYVGVVGELAGVALMAGAPVSGVAAMAGFGLLLIKRIRVENAALATASRGRRASNGNGPVG